MAPRTTTIGLTVVCSKIDEGGRPVQEKGGRQEEGSTKQGTAQGRKKGCQNRIKGKVSAPEICRSLLPRTGKYHTNYKLREGKGKEDQQKGEEGTPPANLRPEAWEPSTMKWRSGMSQLSQRKREQRVVPDSIVTVI